MSNILRVYRSSYFFCENPEIEYYVPPPPEKEISFELSEQKEKILNRYSLTHNMSFRDSLELTSFLQESIILLPKETKTITYDVTPIFLAGSPKLRLFLGADIMGSNKYQNKIDQYVIRNLPKDFEIVF